MVNSQELELSPAKNEFLTFGRPSFYPEDAAIVWSNLNETAVNRLDKAYALRDDCTFGCSAFANDQGLVFFQHILGNVHRAAFQSIFSEAVLSDTGIQLGALIQGASKSADLSLGNAGNQDFEVSAAAMAPGFNAYIFANMYGRAKRVAASSVLVATGATLITAWVWLTLLG